jgi:site-specific recombinase XerD
MITTRFYLDERCAVEGRPSPLKISICKASRRALISLPISLLPSQWDRKSQLVVGHPARANLNLMLAQYRVRVEEIINRLLLEGKTAEVNVFAIKRMVEDELFPKEETPPTFADVARRFISGKSGRTVGIYEATLAMMARFAGDDFERLSFDEINKAWLARFDDFMAQTSPSANARNIHLRNIRSVFNFAIDEGVTSLYPFRKFKIKPEPTRKRAFSVEQIRKIIRTPLSDAAAPYRDMWVLIFLLRGINVVDLCNLDCISGDGRLNYIRAKTHKEYSVKVEPEAAALIQKYSGKDHLLFMLDRYANYRGYYMMMCRGLAKVLEELNAVNDGVTFSELTSYNARHSWATTAALLDIPKETIAAALGHGGSTVTDIYIAFDGRKVDEANRRVIDFIFYGK